MTMKRWGRGLLIWGLVGVVLSLAPALLLSYALPALDSGVLGLIAIMLTLMITPLAAVVASVGAILLLVAVLRGDRF